MDLGDYDKEAIVDKINGSHPGKEEKLVASISIMPFCESTSYMTYYFGSAQNNYGLMHFIQFSFNTSTRSQFL